MIKQFSAVTKEDFKKYISFPYNETINATNNWSWVESERAIEVNATSGQISYVTFNLGDVEVGDILELEADVLNITGSKVKLALDIDSGSGFLNSQSLQTNHGNHYQKCLLSANIVKRGKARLTVGLWTSDIGWFKIRNVVASKKSVRNTSENFRKAVITNKDDNVWKLFSERPNDEATVSIFDEYSVQITFKNPLDVVGISFVSLSEAGTGGRKFIVRSSYETKNNLIIRFQDITTLTTGNVIKLSELTQPLYVSVLFMG